MILLWTFANQVKSHRCTFEMRGSGRFYGILWRVKKTNSSTLNESGSTRRLPSRNIFENITVLRSYCMYRKEVNVICRRKSQWWKRTRSTQLVKLTPAGLSVIIEQHEIGIVDTTLYIKRADQAAYVHDISSRSRTTR